MWTKQQILVEQPAPQSGGGERGESDPARLARIYQSSRPALIIPAGQAFLVALAFGIAFGALIWAGEIYEVIPPRPWAPLLWGFICWAIVQAWALLGGLRRWSSSVKWMENLIEKVLQTDLNGDGQIGDEATDEQESFRIELPQRSETGVAQQTQIFTLPTTPAKFKDLACGVVEGQPLSERQWSGAGALFSQNEFRSLREAMIKRGLLRWTDPRYPNQGLEITRAGKAVFEYFAGKKFPPVQQTDIPSPTPPRA